MDSPSRTKLNHMVAGLDHIKMVLDHQNAVASVSQTMESIEESLDITEMQAGSRLIEQVEGMGIGWLGELHRQLKPLGFSPGKCGRWLTESDVA